MTLRQRKANVGRKARIEDNNKDNDVASRENNNITAATSQQEVNVIKMKTLERERVFALLFDEGNGD